MRLPLLGLLAESPPDPLADVLDVVRDPVWVGDQTAAVRRAAYGVTLQRSYQDRDGKWQRTASLDEGDMLPAAKALEDAYTWIQKERQHSRADHV